MPDWLATYIRDRGWQDHIRLGGMPLGGLFWAYQPLAIIPMEIRQLSDDLCNKAAKCSRPLALTVIKTFLPFSTAPLTWQSVFIHQGPLVHLYNMIYVMTYFFFLRCPILILPHSNSMFALDTQASIFLESLKPQKWEWQTKGAKAQFVTRDMLGRLIFQVKFGSTLKVKAVIKMPKKLSI